MKIRRKKLLITGLLLVMVGLNCQDVMASNLIDNLSQAEYTEEFKKYMQLSAEEQSKRIQPKMFETGKESSTTKNPLKIVRKARSNTKTRFSLRDVIPNNVIVRNQKATNTCWAFASIASLETNLALINKDAKTYDFSERHMDYSMVKDFLNGATNPNKINRMRGSGGNYQTASAYLTNGNGAIPESEMPFENNENMIAISEIQNKTVSSQIYDTVEFPSVKVTEDTTQIKEQLKQHIENYGSVNASIYGADITTEYANNETGAIYCDDAEKCPINHAVAIIGWDDNYDKMNFNEAHRPQNNGAWIIKNSWGEKDEYTLEEMKQTVFDNAPEEIKIENGWKSAFDVKDEAAIAIFEEIGYTVENNTATLKIGDNGIMYVSYEDVNIYKTTWGIEKAADKKDYENIYQYDELGSLCAVKSQGSNTAYIGNKFKKKTTGKEYLTQVAIYAPETYTCKVYVNSKGDSMAVKDLQPVMLKAGETETFNAGYHTLEFAQPIEISQDFAVVVQVQGNQGNTITIAGEAQIPKTVIASSVYDLVQIENGKCFYTIGEEFEKNNWQDLSQLSAMTGGSVYNMDSNIKAFTTSKVEGVQPPDDDKKDEEVQNSNLENAKCDVKSVKAYFFTDKTKKEYGTIDIEVNNITRDLNNDSYEYYYYLSPNQTEENIKNWIKINEAQTDKSKLSFVINTNDVENYEELSKSNTMYLYVKEVAKKGEKQSTVVSKSMLVEKETNIEIYMDNAKIDNVNVNKGETGGNVTTGKDGTVANKILPKTGVKTIVILIAIIVAVGVIIFIRYQYLNKYVK